MLREVLEQRSDNKDSKVKRSRHLLRERLRQVLAEDNKSQWAWSTPKDRATADRVRERILRELVELDVSSAKGKDHQSNLLIYPN